MMKRFSIIGLSALSLWLFSTGCSNSGDSQKEQSESKQEGEAIKKVETPVFNEDSAYAFVKQQVDFGPRVPNTKTHDLCADYLVQKLKALGCQVIEQRATVTAYDNTKLNINNIIAQINPEAAQRIMLSAHWDTRPWADQDTKDKTKPILGANDGASGVGVLLEIARITAAKNPRIGIDIVLFDAEDYGQPDGTMIPPKSDTYCLGSQYWSKNLHIPNYKPMFGILLDMVGAKGATFTKEGNSMQFAPQVVNKIWSHASRIGYSNHFVNLESGYITDDHLYVNSIAGIPTVDIIHIDPNTPSNFGEYWHTHLDNMESVDKNTLKAVGQTLIEVIYHE